MSTDDLKSKQIFNYIFEKAKNEGIKLSPMKAIKLVYFCHAWYLGFKSKPLINEQVQAWEFGAVIPSLYHSLKIYGAKEITFPILYNQNNYMLQLFMQDYSNIPEREIIKTDNLCEDEMRLIDIVWESYKGYTAGQLSGIMHEDGTPWSQSYKPGQMYTIIPNDIIEKYYKDIINSSLDNE